MYLCGDRSQPETVEHTVRINQCYRDDRCPRLEGNLKASGLEIAYMIAVIEVIAALREKNISLAVLYCLRPFFVTLNRLPETLLINPLPI